MEPNVQQAADSGALQKTKELLRGFPGKPDCIDGAHRRLPHANEVSTSDTRASSFCGSRSSTGITVAFSPMGRQRSNIRRTGNPAKIQTSATPHAEAACCPAES